uniref:Ribonuclease H-like domain-containing protein n=1 Tax=Tanacetum cinerariifolium TaxID=118510 RepID=A0A6L2J522_TANCI|nr:ribonuclease H-like domain-containing protein [Tanacetum cinerariifolium]
MGIPNERQLKFNSIKDAKQLLEAVEKRFGENAATKKTQRNLLKQQYENFTASSSEILDQTFDRLQKLKNKADLDTISIDDLYKNIKVYEPEVKGISSLSSSTQNMDFVFSLNNNTSSTSGAVNTANRERSLLLMAMRLLVLVRPMWSVITATRGDILLRSAELQEIKTTSTKKAQEGVCLWKLLLPNLWCHVMDLVDMTRVIRHKKGLIMRSWLSHLQVLTQRNFMPPTPDLSFTDLDEFVNKHVVENYKAKSSKEEPKAVRKNNDALIIKEWVLDNEKEDVSQPKIEKKTVRPSIFKKQFVKSKQQEKTARKSVKQVEHHWQTLTVLEAIKEIGTI